MVEFELSHNSDNLFHSNSCITEKKSSLNEYLPKGSCHGVIKQANSTFFFLGLLANLILLLLRSGTTSMRSLSFLIHLNSQMSILRDSKLSLSTHFDGTKREKLNNFRLLTSTPVEKKFRERK